MKWESRQRQAPSSQSNLRMHRLIRRAARTVALLCFIATTPVHAHETLKLDTPKPSIARTPPMLMLTAWTCARSPLILGNDLRRLDDWTLRLVTNPEVLALLRLPGTREWHSTSQGHRFVCHGPQGTWVAWLNTGEASWNMPLPSWLPDARRDCWARADLPAGTRTLAVPPHGARLVRCA